MGTIYSLTMFFNEFDLLDLKIQEELPHVDCMIIVEADHTHSGQPKTLHLPTNKKYENPKIKILTMGDDFKTDSYSNEGRQRNAALPTNLEDDDILICTDLDEINKSEDMPKIIDAAKRHELVRIAMFNYYYKINVTTSTVTKWCLPFAVTGKYLKTTNKTLTEIRRHEKWGNVISTEGRHFGYLADAQGISYKIKNFLHTNFNRPKYTDIDKIQERIKDLKDPYDRTKLLKVQVDDTYPKTILNNMPYWSKYIES